MLYSSCLLLQEGVFYMEYLQWDLPLDLARISSKAQTDTSFLYIYLHPSSIHLWDFFMDIFTYTQSLNLLEVHLDHWYYINVCYQYFRHQNIWPSEYAVKQQTDSGNFALYTFLFKSLLCKKLFQTSVCKNTLVICIYWLDCRFCFQF